ncbi:oligosaccharide flippase family protein [Winogradskyella algicola]|uniref:oligosaccharide flippase family protein n=1 Tax=Winogradskyella algicola TaxID=2575815 RepID=UPI0011088EFE|nr:oligosaccharide flippase family protein [Winogradskyella algicola]
MSRLLKNKFKSLDIHTREVIKKSIASMFVKGTGMIVALVVSIFLGRAIGASGLGIINLSNRVIAIALVFCLLGTRTVLVKNIAVGYNLKQFNRIGSYMHTAYIFNGLLSIIVVSILLLISPWLAFNVFNEPDLMIPLVVAVISLVPQTFSRLFSAGVNGYRKIWQSNLVDKTLSSILIAISLFLMYITDTEISIVRVAIVYGVSSLIVTIVIGVYWKKLFTNNSKPKFVVKKLIRPALPLLWISISSIISANAAVVLLGWLSNSKEVGLYTVATSIALLTSFFLKVTNSVVSPKLAGLNAEGKKKEMEVMVRQTTKGLTFIAGLPVIIFIIAGKYVLNLWGEEFIVAYQILVILSIGQFFNIATGCSGLLLVMCGFEKQHGYISFVFVVLNLILNFILISWYGLLGAAITMSVTVALENIIKVIVAQKKTGILTLPIKIFK